ncbi:MAG TPA: sigma-70 family RNA polymerase sigma factor [Methylomirabilota bacterium]|nr:sigma-70 family RNA polymerase sigma factor [Methylomirabilota bacterium]
MSFDQASDEQLVRLAVDGDEDAYGLVVRRYQRRLTAFLAQLVGDLEIARELSQETFVRAWSALERFNPSYRFSTWLFRIGHNLAIDHLRRRRLTTVSLQRTDQEGEEVEIVVEDDTKDPLGHFENRELAVSLKRAIEDLRPEYRELVLLRHFAGLSYQEIADLKDMPLGTVKNKLFRAHTVLRNALATFL